MHTRDQVLDWMTTHPQSVRGDPEEVIRSCEAEVRRRAAADAWRTARKYMQGRRDLWERRQGYPITSSRFVAGELCRLFAHELKGIHPDIPAGCEEDLAGPAILSLLDGAAWEEVRDWVHDLALAEERHVWKAVIRFTSTRAAHLPEQREGLEADWDEPDGTYGHAAAVIASQLMEQYEEQARSALH